MFLSANMNEPFDRTSARQGMRQARLDAGLKFRSLSIRLGRAVSTVCEWETGARTPSFADALALESVLPSVTPEMWGYDRATGRHADERALIDARAEARKTAAVAS